MVESLLRFMQEYDSLTGGGSALDVGPHFPVHEFSIRRSEQVETEGAYGFLPSTAINNMDEFFHYFAIWCAFTGVLLCCPPPRHTPHPGHAVDLP